MENVKILMQCIMLVASSSDFLMALRQMKPKIARLFTKAYWIGAAATIGVMLFAQCFYIYYYIALAHCNFYRRDCWNWIFHIADLFFINGNQLYYCFCCIYCYYVYYNTTCNNRCNRCRRNEVGFLTYFIFIKKYYIIFI